MPQYIMNLAPKNGPFDLFNTYVGELHTAPTLLEAVQEAFDCGDFEPEDTVMVLELGKPLSSIKLFKYGLTDVTPVTKDPAPKKSTSKTKKGTK